MASLILERSSEHRAISMAGRYTGSVPLGIAGEFRRNVLGYGLYCALGLVELIVGCRCETQAASHDVRTAASFRRCVMRPLARGE